MPIKFLKILALMLPMRLCQHIEKIST
jgi:hypothetical protein